MRYTVTHSVPLTLIRVFYLGNAMFPSKCLGSLPIACCHGLDNNVGVRLRRAYKRQRPALYNEHPVSLSEGRIVLRNFCCAENTELQWTVVLRDRWREQTRINARSRAY